MLAVVLPAFAEPTFSVERGLYDEAFELDITGTEPVECSIDGAEFSACDTLGIDHTTVIRAREGDGDVVAHTYVFVADVMAGLDATIVDANAETVEGSLRALPTMSLWVDGGLLLTEMPASWEWIDPGGEDAQVNCGAHTVGGTSYVYAKSSVRLSFRSEYGSSKLNLDIYGADATGIEPADQHDTLNLRSGNHDTVFYLGAQGQQLRNWWMDEAQLDMGHVAPHGRMAHLYLNGAYHGVYHVREKFNAAMLAEYFGGSEEDYEALVGGVAVDGSGGAWNTAVAASGDWTEAQRWLDADNFLDYMVLNFYAGNAWDWYPTHNWTAAGPIAIDAGGFRFHSSDSDICLYYDWTVDITSNAGPSYIFENLRTEADPDFQVALMDAIHRNLEGPLSVEGARGRYERLAGLASDAMVVESAIWGYGWWTRDGVWTVERDRLLDGWFPYRTDEMHRQFEAVGWYPMGAPEFSVEPGFVDAGTQVEVSGPYAVWVTTNGEDPRVSGGAVGDQAGAGPVEIEHSTFVKARMQADDGTWGPIAEAFYEVDETPPVVLNEWNAVEPDELLADGDDALGQLAGNGGDWIELLALEDVDLDGWRITMEDRGGSAGDFTFGDVGTLRAGTIVTLAEDLPEDTAYDPDGGDWRFHLRAEDFDVTHRDWRMILWDPEGHPRFGPVGETVAPDRGIGDDEVGLLRADPSPELRRASEDYGDGTRSTYGAPNQWDGGEQDLSSLRGGALGGIVEFGDTGAIEIAGGCGCDGSGGGGWLAVLLVLLVLAGCAERSVGADPICYADADLDGWGAAEIGCAAGIETGGDCDDGDASVSPSAPEVCNGTDDDCDGLVDDDDEVADGLPFYEDLDGDGWGSDSLVVTACTLAEGGVLAGGDCDDEDPAIHPEAAEACDDIDDDCDGAAGDGLGVSSECSASTCLEIVTNDPTASDGAYWIELATGPAEVWCDMSTDGGGWTLAFVRNTASTGNQDGFCGEDQDVEALAVSPGEASASTGAHLGWIGLESYDWTTLQLGAYYSGSESYRSRDILSDDIRIPFGSDGYFLYGGDTGYYWCGGNASYTDGGSGGTDNPAGATPDCKGHGSLGSGWDFSEYDWANTGLTLCGGDGSYWLYAGWATNLVYYGTVGGAQAIWVR